MVRYEGFHLEERGWSPRRRDAPRNALRVAPRGELAEHEAALRQAHRGFEERAIVKRRAVTARRVLEPEANDLGTPDRLAQHRQLPLGDLTQPFRRRAIRGGRLKQKADLVQA